MNRWCNLLISLQLAACAASSGDAPSTRGSGAQGAGTASVESGSAAGSTGSTAAGGSFGNTPIVGGNPRSGGGAGSGGLDTGAGELCNTPGKTRECCVGGTQTCTGSGEFPFWGPCVDANGMTLTGCSMCMPGEFGGSCAPPPPPPPPPPAPECDDPVANSEPEILAAYSPAPGESVSESGQIEVWITDELPAFIAENEEIEPMTGEVVTPGDRGELNIDGYPNEPTLYVTPMAPTLGSGGAYYPQWVKGDYNNKPSAGPDIAKLFDNTTVSKGPAPDPAPPSASPPETYNTEFIWDVSAMQLEPGTYLAKFVIHDGDLDRAVGCNVITIAPGAD